MIVVAGLSLKNLAPRVWDPASEYYLPGLTAVMVSYSDFHDMPKQRAAAMKQGLRDWLNLPKEVNVFLDNGSFAFMVRQRKARRRDYDEFVKAAKPDWWPVPRDFIPSPKMTLKAQRYRFNATMRINRQYNFDGYVPVIHISPLLASYTRSLQSDAELLKKPRLALGAIVPNLLRAPKARPHEEILKDLLSVRSAFRDKELHLFGVGGTATVHLAALLGIHSVDSSGWRNRAARGIVQLPGSGDRVVANLGKWRGRTPDKTEWDLLRVCKCPACVSHGLRGLKRSGLKGFCNRATHNLWILLEEADWIQRQLAAGTYACNFGERLNNSTYGPLVEKLAKKVFGDDSEQISSPTVHNVDLQQASSSAPRAPQSSRSALKKFILKRPL